MLDSEIKIHPYPKIPLLPEEREVMVSQGEEKLPGTPKSAEASLLLDREINKVLRFDGKNSQDIKNFCRSLLEDWVNNPDNMVGFFSRAYEQSQNSQDFATRVKTLETCLTQNLADLLKRVESPKANAIGKFMKLAVTNPIYGDRARAILRGFFENAHTPAQFIDLLYEFGIAFMKESDRQMSDELCKILLWDSDICPRSRERAMRYLLALYMQGGEVVFKKWTEIDAVIAMFCKKQLPESSQLFIEQINDIGDDRELWMWD